ncbi:MAG TPA: MMPL family transporter [Usitatibacter sp.]|nr:MMPL family transporter [Usitatibacter sp.]
MPRGRRLALGLWLAGLALAIFAVTQARFVADLSSFLPSAPTPEQRLLVDQLRDGAISRVVMVGIEGADASTHARLSHALAAALRADPRFAFVANGASVGFERERDLLLAHRYVLSPHVTPERFTAAGLKAAVAETIDLLASPAGLLAKALVPRDPTGELLAVVEMLRPEGGPQVVDGAWASPDGRRAILLARTRAAGSDIDAQAEAIAALDAAFAKARSEAGAAAANARAVMTGPGVFAARSRAMIEHDVKRLTTVSAGIVIVLLLLVYRSPVALALGLVPVVSGALAGIAAVSLGFGAVHGITLGFGTTLIGEAVDYSIYLFVQAGRGDQAGDDGWIRGFWPTVRLGVLTSIAGFSALVFSGLPGLAQLGVYSIVGLIVAAAVTRFVLPQLLPASFRIRDISALGERLVVASRAAHRLRWAVALVALGAAAVLALHRGPLWDPELSSLNPISAADRQVDTELRAALGAADARHMVAVHGASADATLGAAERAAQALDPLVAQGKLAGYDNPARYLPSAATQRARLESLPDAATLRASLREALTGSPLAAAKLEPFIADAERARSASLLTREQVAGTALDAALEGLLFRDREGRWTALLGLRAAPSQPIDAAAIRARLDEAKLGDAFILDLKAEVNRLYSGYFERALLASAAGLLAIVALLYGALRSARRVALVMAPLLAGVLLVAAWHVARGTQLSLLHLVGLLLVIAIGSNYALFFDKLAHGGGDAAPRTLASLALANLTTVASFGVLGLSQIPVLAAIGSTVALGAFVTLIFSAAVAGRGIIRA